MTPPASLPAVPSLVVGHVSHERRTPLRHAFRHRSYQWLVDVDDLPRLPRWLRPLASFRVEDHLDGGATGGGIRGDLAAVLARHGADLAPTDRVLMLANARVLGHVFDPLSVFWVLAADDTIRAVVFEVHNTYDGGHVYVLDLDERGHAHAAKAFYVSPFNDVSGSYAITLRTDPSRVSVTVGLDRQGTRILTATTTGTPRSATPGAVLRVSLTHLLMPQRVSALIRVHGILLWLRRLPIVPRPSSARAVTTGRARPSTDATPRDVPSLAPPTAAGARARVAEQLLRLVARRVPVDIALPDGTLLGRRSATFDGRPRIDLHRPDVLFRRVADNPKIGIGEGYTAGDWSASDGSDLADVLTPFAERLSSLLPSWLIRMRRLVDQPIPDDQLGAVEHTQGNIAAHYDLSNEMFAAFLDRTMSYSSAMFDPDRPLGEQDLHEGQMRKIRAALDLANVGAGTELLEIGTGWGSLAIEAARRGARVTTVTLSVEQAALARTRIEEAGLTDRVDVVVQDYREVTGRYDAIVSVEMIEAVGERYWPAYFATLSRLLRPGGAVSLQAIVMSHQRYLATRRSYGWIQKHVFPGGLIPSETAIAAHAGRAGLAVTRTDRFGPDYAETLRRWRSAFLEAWPSITSERFGEPFRRTWEFYLAYCEAGFRTGYLDVVQLRLEPLEQTTG